MIKNLKKKKSKIDILKFMTLGEYCLKIAKNTQKLINLILMELKICNK
jgi:hypothetical protein